MRSPFQVCNRWQSAKPAHLSHFRFWGG
uniref:Uncharacterized protein n=1 Tax=Nelumbo nucifera TaxID=4432 RepID=A0A822ZA93_NELNU|nr:TPA_asm: hypothetical protein HUJ06_000252 [Nelumbo nucifera]